MQRRSRLAIESGGVWGRVPIKTVCLSVCAPPLFLSSWCVGRAVCAAALGCLSCASGGFCLSVRVVGSWGGTEERVISDRRHVAWDDATCQASMHSALNSVLGVAVASLRQLFSSLATASTDREPAIGRVGLERRCSRECVALDARCGSDRRQFGDWRSDSVVDGPRGRDADRRHPGRGREQTRRPVAWRRQRSEGVFFL